MLKISAPVRIDISAGWPDSDPYRKDFGGCVLNAAINRYVSATFDGNNIITSSNDVPPSSGLGTSGALRAAYLVASNPKLLEDKSDLVKRVHIFENQVIGHRAGFQDEAASVYGGVNYFEFFQNSAIRRNLIPEKTAKHLEDRIVILYTGKSHLSSNIHNLVFGPNNYEKNISKLDKMKEYAKIMAENIENENIMSDLIRETWDLQKSLHNSIETPLMKKLQKDFSSLYSAFRATGAGGGGCVIFYTSDKEELLKELKRKKVDYKGIEIIQFNFDYKGIRIES
jgi:D-glycero-alpha-D-manno-heptose-7-phosphate kinase